ncbi:uncharacterized protein LOC141649097 [Silene latifolia]|uniref:uncharacterized protein LOC141649097 n=1 Tax=Silene latifolia TaxID=37657 RepID=UPI003D7731AF
MDVSKHASSTSSTGFEGSQPLMPPNPTQNPTSAAQTHAPGHASRITPAAKVTLPPKTPTVGTYSKSDKGHGSTSLTPSPKSNGEHAGRPKEGKSSGDKKKNRELWAQINFLKQQAAAPTSIKGENQASAMEPVLPAAGSHRNAGDLYRIIQGASETIGEFNTRFNNEKVAVRECDVSTTVEAFRRGLYHESDLYKQLTMHPCHSFEAMLEKAAAAIRLEEDMLARASVPSTPSVSSTSAIEKSSRKQSTGKIEERYKLYGRGVNRIDNREENEQLYTLAEYGFTTGVGGILKALREIKDGVRELRRLYEQGELSHLLPRGGKQQDKVGSAKQSKPTTPPTCTKIINVITGGSDLSGLTYSAAKRHATETKGGRPKTFCRISHNDFPAVTFDEEDVHDSQEHHDAVIRTLSMANYMVRKVLVDTGSSVNLVMLKTIKNIGFSEKDLQNKTIPLVGYSGETASSLGEIVILTYAGGINKQVRYLVIDGPSTYNVILGRPWLQLMKAVPSTYHQCVKFPTPWGVEKIRGDQEEARGFYNKALKCTASPPA